jgi:hypothetical protein
MSSSARTGAKRRAPTAMEVAAALGEPLTRVISDSSRAGAAGAGLVSGGGGGGGGGATRAVHSSSGLTLRDRVIDALERAGGALSSRLLQLEIPSATPAGIATELQALLSERRVDVFAMRTAPGMPRSAVEEHTYKLVSAEKAARLKDLAPEDVMVLQHVERGATQGVWVRNIKIATRLQQTQINKILKRLEGRKLVKPVQSVAFKNRRMYMMFDLEPDKALTGGPWYTEQELDLSFVMALRR